jgi:AcrR family transcriptional regulator
VAARLLAEEGRAAVSARRVATEAGASTMAVYTHYGSMEELFAAVSREGFRRFGEQLERPAKTDDPVADFMTQGWGYRHFALVERDLYRVMFSDFRLASGRPAEDETVAAMAFLSLLGHVERCAAAGRWKVDDVWTAGEVVWAASHGHATLEQSGYHRSIGRDPNLTFAEILLHLSLGYGDDSDLARASLATSRRRARKAGQDA